MDHHFPALTFQNSNRMMRYSAEGTLLCGVASGSGNRAVFPIDTEMMAKFTVPLESIQSIQLELNAPDQYTAMLARFS